MLENAQFLNPFGGSGDIPVESLKTQNDTLSSGNRNVPCGEQ